MRASAYGRSTTRPSRARNRATAFGTMPARLKTSAGTHVHIAPVPTSSRIRSDFVSVNADRATSVGNAPDKSAGIGLKMAFGFKYVFANKLIVN